MKSSLIIYLSSLSILALSYYLLLNYSNSGRYHMIAGILSLIGIILNCIGYLSKNKTTPLS
ncbi:MAG: hypothetical protein VW080_02185 [Flavobacteriaceae bacterium]